MKKLIFLVTIIASLAAISPLASAKDKKDKDKDKDKDRDRYEEYEKKNWKDTRNAVRELNQQYERMRQQMQGADLSRRLRDEVGYIGMDIRRISDQFERDSYDPRDLRNRIARANDSLQRAREQFDYERSHYNSRGGRYSRPF